MRLIKPMLAKPADKVKGFNPLGWYASGKIDGFRATVQLSPTTGKAVVYTRSLKPHPNKHVQHLFAKDELVGCDGELVVEGNFNAVSSALRKQDGKPDVTFWVFDFLSEETFVDRAARLAHIKDLPGVQYLPHFLVQSEKTVEEINDHFVAEGFEGVCFRSARGFYKEGPNRSSDLVKFKTFTEGDATVVGVEPVQRNLNEPFTDALGRQKRSSKMLGKLIDHSQVGALICVSGRFKKSFKVGSGFDHETARAWVDNPPKKIRFKHQPYGSTEDRPRIPIFVKQII